MSNTENKLNQNPSNISDDVLGDDFDVFGEDLDFSLENARALAKEGKVEEAKKIYNSLQLALHDPETYYEVANFYHSIGENTQAKEFYEKSLALAPDDKTYLDGYARMLCAISQFSECEKYLIARISLGHSTVTTYFWLGESLRLQGKVRAAQTAYLIALKMSPEDVMLRLALVTLASETDSTHEYNAKHYQDAMEACINGDIDGAVRLLKEAVMLTSINPSAYDPASEEGLDVLLSSITKGSDKQPYLNEFVSVSERELTPHKIILLAKIKLVENKIDDALEQLNIGIAKFPEDDELPDFYTTVVEKRSMNEALEYIEDKVNSYSSSFKLLAHCGKLQVDTGNYKDALISLSRAYQLNPDNEGNNKYLIEACRMTNNLSMAIEVVRKSINAKGESEDSYLLIGNLMSQMNNVIEASTYFDMAQKTNPNSPKGLMAQAKMFIENNMMRDAIIVLRAGMSKFKEDLDFLILYAEVLAVDGQLIDAANVLRKVLAFSAKNQKAKKALADILLQQGSYPEAARFYRDLLQDDKNNSELMVTLAEVYELSGNDSDAKELYKLAIDKNSKFLKAKEKLAFCRLRQENFSQGIESYEIISATVHSKHKWKTPVPMWKGEPIEGKTLVLYQNVSDAETILFARYFKYLQKMGANLELLVETSLVRLMSPFANAATDYPRPADYSLPISAIPKIFNINIERIPNSKPYIKPDQLLMAPWNSLFANSRNKRVGLVWRSEKNKADINHYDRVSSIDLAFFSDLVNNNRNIDFISFQTGEAGINESRSFNLPMRQGGEISSDWADIACGISKVDLVITTDRTVAHIAGAMGVEGLVMLSLIPSWYWFTNRDVSPWYPSLKLYRQLIMGDWHPLISDINLQLQKLLAVA